MKMNKVTAITTFLAVALSAHGQIPDLPIKNQNVLGIYAASKTTQVCALASTMEPSSTNGAGSVPVDSSTFAGINDTLRRTEVPLTVINHEGGCYLWAGAFGADGSLYFSVYKEFFLDTVKGGYALPAGCGDIELSLCDNIHISELDGAQMAIVSLLGPDGQTMSQYSLPVSNGQVNFPRQLAGENAILSVLGSDNTWQYWNISTGSAIQPDSFSLSLNPSIAGVYMFADENVFLELSANGVITNPTAELKSTSKQWLAVAFSTASGDMFTGVWVRKAGETQWNYYSVPDGMQYVPVPVQEGTYWMFPTWKDGVITPISLKG
jgi:hypothetical protein